MKTNLIYFFILFTPLIYSQALPLETPASHCIIVFYDESPKPDYWMGKTYSQFLQNLLAHFPKYQLYESPIENYQPGDIELCKVSFYIGSYFENNIPKSFFKDFKETNRTVVWLGYSIWVPGLDYFNEIFGFEYNGLTELNKTLLDKNKKPSFFKYVHYKDEIFEKWGEFSLTDPETFLGAWETIILKKTRPSSTQILATQKHSAIELELPYVISNKNKYYFTEVPFSFMHEGDRFLVFVDLLFDILNEKPIHDIPYAFLRIEDIFPQIELSYVYDVIDTLNNEKVKANFAIVPFYVDPFDVLNKNIYNQSGDTYPPFLELIKDLKNNDHSFIWHGVTHQYGRTKNPHTGVTTEDFEFWDAINSKPLKEDSPDFVLNRLELGLDVLRELKIKPLAWLTPHYQASPLNYFIFGDVFNWNVGRVIYYNINNTPYLAPDSQRNMLSTDKNSTKNRKEFFKNFSVDYSGPWSGQMFPYLIFGDIYGQKLIPESLGNSQPYKSNHVIWPRSVKQILTDAKRNLKIRDAWASVFFHPALLAHHTSGGKGQFPGDTQELIQLIQGLKNLGYTFITLKDLENKWGAIKKRAPTQPLTKRRTHVTKKEL